MTLKSQCFFKHTITSLNSQLFFVKQIYALDPYIINYVLEVVVKILKLIALLTSLAAAAGCAKTASENVKTSGFYVTYKVTGNNQNSAVCTASFQVGGALGTYLELSSGDNITCDGQQMSRSEYAGIVTYSTNVSYQVGKTYSLVLSRAGEGDYTSSVVLPTEIFGASPANNSSFQKGSAISVSWIASSNASEGMKIYLNYSSGSASYTYVKQDSAPEIGVGYGFGSNETQVNPPVFGTWSGAITFGRYLEGSMDAALAGSIKAVQESQISINLTD